MYFGTKKVDAHVNQIVRGCQVFFLSSFFRIICSFSKFVFYRVVFTIGEILAHEVYTHFRWLRIKGDTSIVGNNPTTQNT